MNDPSTNNGYSSSGKTILTVVDGFDAFTPELAALRDARKRAFDARIAAENALRQAEEAEAGLLAQEEQALAAATAARREQATELARIAAGREREAMERVARIETQLQQSAQAREQAQIAESSVIQSRDEAQRALDRLEASLAGFQEQLRSAENNQRALETELARVREAAQEASRAREQAESLLPGVMTQTIGAPVTAADPARPSPVSDLLSIAAQRAAERRAADAARAKLNP